MRLLLALAAFLVALAFGAVGAVTLVTGKTPGTRSPDRPPDDDMRVGWTALGVGIVAGGVGGLLLRARARDRADRRAAQELMARAGLPTRGGATPAHGGSGAWKGIAAAGLGLGVLGARFGDDLLRHADDVARSTDGAGFARVLDDLAGARAAVHTSGDQELLERALEIGDLLLTANDARELFELVRAQQNDEPGVVIRMVLHDTVERYQPLGNDRFALVEQRRAKYTSTVQQGGLVAQEAVIDEDPPDAAAGESIVLVFESPHRRDDGAEVCDVRYECRIAPGPGRTPVAFTVPTEVELLRESASTGDVIFRLRSTAAGRAREAVALAEQFERLMVEDMARRPEVTGRTTVDVRVPEVATMEFTLTPGSLEARSSGRTVIDVIVGHDE